MNTIEIGQQFTTRVSGVTGIVEEIIEKGSQIVLRLNVNGQDRFTTV
jgi:hypothetical protein